MIMNSAWTVVPVKAGEIYLPSFLDVEDFERLGDRRLSLGSHGYAQMCEGAVMTVHSWVMGTRGLKYRAVVDYTNRNKLDNRRSNLRIVTASESNLNRPQADDPYVGTYSVRSGRWSAKFKWQRRQHYVGTFDTRDEARDALLAYRIEHYPETVRA